MDLQGGDDGGGQPRWSRVLHWVVDHARLAVLVPTVAALYFALQAAASILVALSVARLVGLIGAPYVARSRYAWGRLHRRHLVIAFTEVLVALLLRLLSTTVNDRRSLLVQTTTAVVFPAMVFVWGMAHAASTGYTNDRGGLLVAYGIRNAAEGAVELFDPQGTTLPTFDAVAKAVMGAVVSIALFGGLASPLVTRVRMEMSDDRSPKGLVKPTDDKSKDVVEPPANPKADALCGFNVYNAIARGIPTAVANALASVYGGASNPPVDDAPGAEVTGCPLQGSVREGALYITQLYDPKSRAEKGMLISTDEGAAAVVYPTLLDRAKELLADGTLMRVDHRQRTRLGDMAAFYLSNGECSLSIREYGQDYIELSPVMTVVFANIAVSKAAVPRITARDAPTGRTEYTLTFASRTEIQVVYDAALGTAVRGSGSDSVQTKDNRCPDIGALYDLAGAEAPPAADHTP